MSKPEDCAPQIVHEIVADLLDRRGLRHEWLQIDLDIQYEIIETWTKIVTKHLKADEGS